MPVAEKQRSTALKTIPPFHLSITEILHTTMSVTGALSPPEGTGSRIKSSRRKNRGLIDFKRRLIGTVSIDRAGLPQPPLLRGPRRRERVSMLAVFPVE